MSRLPLFVLGLFLLTEGLSACEELPESVVRRNSAQQGSLNWDSGFAPLPPLSETSATSQTAPQPHTGFSELPPLPFPALSPVPTPSPLPLEAAPAPTSSPAPDSSPSSNPDSSPNSRS